MSLKYPLRSIKKERKTTIEISYWDICFLIGQTSSRIKKDNDDMYRLCGRLEKIRERFGKQLSREAGV
ncbi:hypothetical protein FACS189461_1440 [Spirochaetia bacterium]|nr:hypothetical protein FACS189461_1440 [Spirochaetia bacterium]